jgi:hypothetical protein
MTKTQKDEIRSNALKHLRDLLKPGQTVYTILRHRSASGISRSISVVSIGQDGEVRDLDYLAAKLLGYRIDERRGGLKVSECGMDMGFHLVDCLGRAVWPMGAPEPHGTRNGEPDSCGGDALKHRWM